MKTIEEIRLANLSALRAGFPSERQFAIKLNKAPNQVNQWFGKGSARSITSESAREVEAIMGKPAGWLDNDHSQPATLNLAILQSAIVALKESAERSELELDIFDAAPALAYVYGERMRHPEEMTRAEYQAFDEQIRMKLSGGMESGNEGRRSAESRTEGVPKPATKAKKVRAGG